MSAWTADFPKPLATDSVLIGPYKGNTGWHLTRAPRSGEDVPGILGAIVVCRNHFWTGYIAWSDLEGDVNVDSCSFIRRAAGDPDFQ